MAGRNTNDTNDTNYTDRKSNGNRLSILYR